jgi:aminomethyltransferase
MSLLQTACHGWHAAHHGRLVDFAGWDMPVQYTSIVEEHHAVRKQAGLFDIGHMGRLRFRGPDAGRLLSHVTTVDAESLSVGQVKYALVTNEAGGILDDVLVYRFPSFFMLVVNASNRVKIVNWIDAHRTGFDASMEDLTVEWTMLAIQGPKALTIAEPLVGSDARNMGYYTATEGIIAGVPGIISRTGYTGEDGLELIVPADHGQRLWEQLLDRGSAQGIKACGLGARDTLRLEAAMPLYGHEMNESTDPYTAGLAFGVQLEGHEFLGKAAVATAKSRPDRPKRVGLELAGRRIAREGAIVFAGETEIGRVTSGTFSPTLERSIAMAYVAPAQATVGATVAVDIRGNREAATIVKLPFYRRPKTA